MRQRWRNKRASYQVQDQVGLGNSRRKTEQALFSHLSQVDYLAQVILAVEENQLKVKTCSAFISPKNAISSLRSPRVSCAVLRTMLIAKQVFLDYLPFRNLD
jgi:hypothetical protein